MSAKNQDWKYQGGMRTTENQDQTRFRTTLEESVAFLEHHVSL